MTDLILTKTFTFTCSFYYFFSSYVFICICSTLRQAFYTLGLLISIDSPSLHQVSPPMRAMDSYPSKELNLYIPECSDRCNNGSIACTRTTLPVTTVVVCSPASLNISFFPVKTHSIWKRDSRERGWEVEGGMLDVSIMVVCDATATA